MHSAIFVVKMPPSPLVSTHWGGYLAGVRDLPAIQLAENVWLIDMQEHPAALARLIDAAAQLNLPYMFLPLGAEAQWLPISSHPEAMRLMS